VCIYIERIIVKRLIGPRMAANILLAILALLAVYHILILFKVLPSGMVWGGRAESSGESLVLLESVGLVVTILFAGVVASKAGYFRGTRFKTAVKVAMWIVFGYFVLNVFGNLMSTSLIERSIFTPVSIIVALLSLRLALEK
jgi:hypothetical protein